MKVNGIDFEWRDTVANFRHCIAHYRTLREVCGSIGFSASTLRKILNGEKPSLICQIKIEEWIKKNWEGKAS